MLNSPARPGGPETPHLAFEMPTLQVTRNMPHFLWIHIQAQRVDVIQQALRFHGCFSGWILHQERNSRSNPKTCKGGFRSFGALVPPGIILDFNGEDIGKLLQVHSLILRCMDTEKKQFRKT